MLHPKVKPIGPVYLSRELSEYGGEEPPEGRHRWDIDPLSRRVGMLDPWSDLNHFHPGEFFADDAALQACMDRFELRFLAEFLLMDSLGDT